MTGERADDPRVTSDLELVRRRLADDPEGLAAVARLAERLAVDRPLSLVQLYTISHDLRTHLGAILGYADLLRADPGVGGEARAHAEVVHRSAQDLWALLRELTGSVRDTIAQRDGFDLHDALDDLADMLCLRAAGVGVALRFDRPPDLPRRIFSDPRPLVQLLLELIGNILEAPRGDAVTVRVQLDRTPGVAAAVLRSTIAAPGLQPGELRLRPLVGGDAGLQPGGAGGGLEAAEARARELGGGLFAAPGQLVVSIPVGLGPDMDPPRDGRKVLGLAPGQGELRILVAEDRWESRQLLVQTLERVGFRVREAADGREALQLWETWRPHLVWMDMRMPVVSGLEATQRIKQSPQGKGTIVVALTASAFEADEATARAAGCDDFVRKPLDMPQVFAKLAEHLGVRYVHEELGAPDRLEPDVLAGLPVPWLSALQQASTLADVGAIQRMIDFIRGQAPRAAAVLLDLAEQYNYPAIIDLTRHAIQAARGGT